jgi:hypothetical protein
MCTAYGIVTHYEWPWWSYSTQVERELREVGNLYKVYIMMHGQKNIKFCPHADMNILVLLAMDEITCSQTGRTAGYSHKIYYV